MVLTPALDAEMTARFRAFRTSTCQRCGMGYSDALNEHLGGWHDSEMDATLAEWVAQNGEPS